VPASTSPQPFVPAVCHLCGRILENASIAASVPHRHDLTGPVSSSDPTVCLYCETTLNSEFAESTMEYDVLAFLTGMAVPAPEAEFRAPRLVIVNSRREIRLPAVSIVYLGRRDEEHNIQPNIDLTPDGARKRGVSRRHARIHLKQEGVFIEDLGSTNGTFINGQRLFPAKLYPLDHGDMLHLGKLKLAVTYSHDTPTKYSQIGESLDRGIPISVDAQGAHGSR